MKLLLAGVAALILVSSGASAEQALKGTVVEVDRIHDTVAIRPAPGGTVGAAEEFKVQDGVALDDVHAGDTVTASTTDAGGVATVTKFQKP
jgi:Cu/Ag efflux protein CusF